jgi:hypothetical protein
MANVAIWRGNNASRLTGEAGWDWLTYMYGLTGWYND